MAKKTSRDELETIRERAKDAGYMVFNHTGIGGRSGLKVRSIVTGIYLTFEVGAEPTAKLPSGTPAQLAVSADKARIIINNLTEFLHSKE